jgi:hypothetical protein
MKRILWLLLLIIVSVLIFTSISSCVSTAHRDTESYLKEKAQGVGDIKIGGYNEEERKQIFLELIDLEKKAEKEAIEKYPTNSSDPNYLEGNFQKYLEYKKELMVKYAEELCKKYNLTYDQLNIMKGEGFQKNWYRED